MSWIKIDQLPEMFVPVWALNEGRIMMLVREMTPEGWQWCRTYDAPAWKDGWYYEAHLDDEYKPTMWHPLPDIPELVKKK